MLLLKCQCCGIEREFTDGEEAFKTGWDAPPHFRGYVTCNLCPAVCVVLHESHALAHALWEKEGRPHFFTVEKCGTDGDIADPETAKAEMAAIEAWLRNPTKH